LERHDELRLVGTDTQAAGLPLEKFRGYCFDINEAGKKTGRKRRSGKARSAMKPFSNSTTDMQDRFSGLSPNPNFFVTEDVMNRGPGRKLRGQNGPTKKSRRRTSWARKTLANWWPPNRGLSRRGKVETRAFFALLARRLMERKKPRSSKRPPFRAARRARGFSI